MLKNWDDINQMTRAVFGDEEAPLPPGMFGNIQKKLFWSNAILFAKAYMKVIIIATSGFAVMAALLGYFMISKHSAARQETVKTAMPAISMNQSKPIAKIHLPGNEPNTDKTINQRTVNELTGKEQNKISNTQINTARDESIKNEIPETAAKDNRQIFSMPVQNQSSGTSNLILLRSPVDFLPEISLQGIPELQLNPALPHPTEYYSIKAPLGLMLKVYGGPVFSKGSRKYVPEINNPEISTLHLHSAFTTGNSAGVAACFGIKHWRLQIGLHYSSLKMNYSEKKLLYNSHIDTFTFISGYNAQINRHDYYHYTYRQDSIIHTVDSVYTTEYDTTFIPVYEHGRKVSSDTLKQLTWKESFFILEFPVTVGYSMHFNNIEIGLNCGLILGYTVGTRYKTYSGSEGTMPFTATGEYYNYKSLLLSGVASLSAIYWAGRHTGIELAPFYRRSLLDIYSYDKKSRLGYQQFGVHLGIIYKF